VAVGAGYLAEGTCSYHSAWYGVAAENGSAITQFWADSLGDMKEKVAGWADYEIVHRQRQREQEETTLRSLSNIAPGARVGVGPRVPIVADSRINDGGTLSMFDQFGNEIWSPNGTTPHSKSRQHPDETPPHTDPVA